MLTKSIIENIFLVIGESFWFFAGAAQLRHVIKTRNTRGLSAPSVTLNAAGNIAWIVYFVDLKLWFPVVTNILVLSVTLPLIGYILADKKKFGAALASVVTISPITSYFLITYPGISGWLAMSYNWIAGTPQLAKVISHKKVPGISEHSILFILGATTSVMIYGALIGSKPLVAGGIQGIVYELIIASYYYRYRKHA